MVVVSIGTDIVALARVEEVLRRHPDAFPRRILNEAELACYWERGTKVAYLAKRFAAKEAISKALGTGIGAISWRDLCVLNDEAGAPVVTLFGAAPGRLARLGGVQIHVSIADERDYVVAFAVIDG